MSMPDQVQQLEQRGAGLRHSLDVAGHETTEEIRARIEDLRATEAAGFHIVKDDATDAASRAQSKWAAAKADVAAKVRDVQDRIDRKRDAHDVKAAQKDAEWAEANAADALDFAGWAIDQAAIAALEAVDARARADALAVELPTA